MSDFNKINKNYIFKIRKEFYYCGFLSWYFFFIKWRKVRKFEYIISIHKVCLQYFHSKSPSKFVSRLKKKISRDFQNVNHNPLVVISILFIIKKYISHTLDLPIILRDLHAIHHSLFIWFKCVGWARHTLSILSK